MESTIRTKLNTTKNNKIFFCKNVFNLLKSRTSLFCILKIMVGEEGKEIRESYVGWWCDGGGKDRSYSRISGLQYIDPEINEPSVFFVKQ